MIDALVRAMLILILAALSYLQSNIPGGMAPNLNAPGAPYVFGGMAPNPFASNPAPPLSIPRPLKVTTPNVIPDAPPEQSFDDVPPDYWAYEEIELIYSYGITVGCCYDPPLYCPERALTRAEVAVMLARVLAIIESER